MFPFSEFEDVGEPDENFLHDIIATVLEITTAAWSHILTRGDVHVASTEQHIAGCLKQAMVDEKKRRFGPRSRLRIEEEVGTRSAPDIPKPDGRIDIKIIYSYDEDEYFGMECKRVSGTDSALAKKYVYKGLMRFVTGKYGSGHNLGALLGFVIDGDSINCIKLICEHLANTRTETCMQNDWTAETRFGPHKDLYSTLHRQHSFLITILHLFLTITSDEPPAVSTQDVSPSFSSQD